MEIYLKVTCEKQLKFASESTKHLQKSLTQWLAKQGVTVEPDFKLVITVRSRDGTPGRVFNPSIFIEGSGTL